MGINNIPGEGPRPVGRVSAAPGEYRLAHLLLPPNLVSSLRVPLGVMFVAFSNGTALPLIILALGSVSDLVDGVLARRHGQATPIGAVVDGVLDKAFAAAVVGSLVWRRRLSLSEAILLGTRELGELPLVTWWALHRGRRQARADNPRANWLGKLATTVQLASVGLVLRASPAARPFIGVAAICGAASAALYWRRELRVAR